jgi:hypothetical protein
MYDASRREAHSGARLRTLLVWSGVSAGAAGLATLTVPLLLTSSGTGFADLLVRACAGLALAAGGGLWVLTTEVAWSVLAGRRPVRGRGALGPLRALLLAACGVAALHAPAAAAGNEQPDPAGPRVLDGLPLPDRAGSRTDAAPVSDHARDRSPSAVVVRPGDCLWRIAEERLGPRAGLAEVATYWQRIHGRNRDVIGPDPDLILPGQQLQLPAIPQRKDLP